MGDSCGDVHHERRHQVPIADLIAKLREAVADSLHEHDDQVGGIEVAIAVEVAFGPDGRRARIVFADLEEFDQIRRIEDAVEIYIGA